MKRKPRLSLRRLHRTAVGPSAVVLAALWSSCAEPNALDTQHHEQTQALRGGVSAETVLGDDAAAIATIVDDNDAVVCTATFIAPHHVLTAAHCFQPALGPLEQALTLQGLWLTTSRGVHLALLTVETAPAADAAVVAVAGTSDVFLAVDDDVSAAEVGTVQVVGAGRGADAYDRRTAVFAIGEAGDAPLWTLSPTDDDNGVCPGDSGGPLLVARDGTWRVIGVHKSGQFDCRGEGRATPLSGLAPWISATVVDNIAMPEACASEDARRCRGAVVERCMHGVWRGADCALAQYLCVDDHDEAACAPTPCEGVSAAGECDGTTALSCRFGSLWRETCSATEVCALDEVEGRMGCTPCAYVCDDACVSVLDDNAHCGSCTTACGPGEQCVAGSCAPRAGEGEGEGEGAADIRMREGCVGAPSPSLMVLLVTLRRRWRAVRFHR